MADYGYQSDGSYIDPNSGQRYTPAQIMSGMKAGTFDPRVASQAANVRWRQENPEEYRRIASGGVQYRSPDPNAPGPETVIVGKRVSPAAERFIVEGRIVEQRGSAYVDPTSNEVLYAKTAGGVYSAGELKKGVYYSGKDKVVTQAFTRNDVLKKDTDLRYVKPGEMGTKGVLITSTTGPVKTQTTQTAVNRNIFGFIPNPFEKQDEQLSNMVWDTLLPKGTSRGDVEFHMGNILTLSTRLGKPEYEIGYGLVSTVMDRPITGAVEFGASYALTYGLGSVAVTSTSLAAKGVLVPVTSRVPSAINIGSKLVGALFVGTSGVKIATADRPFLEAGRIAGYTAPTIAGGILGLKATPTDFTKVDFGKGYLDESGAARLKMEFKYKPEETVVRDKTGKTMQQLVLERGIAKKAASTITTVDVRPTVDLSKVAIEYTAKPGTKLAMSNKELMMVTRQYGLTAEELVFAKTNKLTLNELLSMRITPVKAQTIQMPALKTTIDAPLKTYTIPKSFAVAPLVGITANLAFSVKQDTKLNTILGVGTPVKTRVVTKQATSTKVITVPKGVTAVLTATDIINVTSTKTKQDPFAVTINDISGVSVGGGGGISTRIIPGGNITPGIFVVPKLISPPMKGGFLSAPGGYSFPRARRGKGTYSYLEVTPVWTPKVAVFGTGKKKAKKSSNFRWLLK